MSLAKLRALLAQEKDAKALTELQRLVPVPEELAGAAELALQLGRPSLAAAWWRAELERPGLDAGQRGKGQLGLAAALCRLGDGAGALVILAETSDTPRTLVLRARAESLLERGEASGTAVQARALAHAWGDVAALIAAVTLLGELHQARGEARAALHALAEGLKVAEIAGQEADAHLLAVLAAVQAALGSAPKARATAQKALSRSLPRSPARVLALRVLGRESEAWQEAEAGELPDFRV